MQGKTTVYLAGKITGDPDYREKFAAARAELEKLGYIVMDPSVLPAGFKWHKYIDITSHMLDACDVVCLLPDWTDSRGAMYEYGRATVKYKTIVPYVEWLKEEQQRADEQGRIAKSSADSSEGVEDMG